MFLLFIQLFVSRKQILCVNIQVVATLRIIHHMLFDSCTCYRRRTNIIILRQKKNIEHFDMTIINILIFRYYFAPPFHKLIDYNMHDILVRFWVATFDIVNSHNKL